MILGVLEAEHGIGKIERFPEEEIDFRNAEATDRRQDQDLQDFLRISPASMCPGRSGSLDDQMPQWYSFDLRWGCRYTVASGELVGNGDANGSKEPTQSYGDELAIQPTIARPDPIEMKASGLCDAESAMMLRGEGVVLN
ncbi:MAG: hypothetical protein KDN22_33450 [Verrucomicrobiae bacterium]|nr:hypothetical protein [Verrucomicrobiae bacterium]